jgi:hypothetical protein
MKKNLVKSVVATLSMLLLITAGCAEEAKEEAGAGAGGTGGGSFASSDLAKTWTSNCLVGTHPISTTSTNHKIILTLGSGGSYSYDDYYYASSTCSNAATVFVETHSGTWTLSGTQISMSIGGSAYSDIMPYGTQIQTDMNNACGGTSPFQGGGSVSSSNNGHHYTTYTLLCMSASMPTSTDHVVYNTVTYANSQMTLMEGNPGVGGFFSSGQSSGTTVTFH